MSEDKKTGYEHTLRTEAGHTVAYTELPLKKGSRRGYAGLLDDVPCMIYRRRSSISALNCLMKRYPILDMFEDEKSFAPSILECFEAHGAISGFSVTEEGTAHELLALPEVELWESAEEDLTYLLNMIHYCEDYEETDGGVFMSDYGLC